MKKYIINSCYFLLAFIFCFSCNRRQNLEKHPLLEKTSSPFELITPDSLLVTHYEVQSIALNDILHQMIDSTKSIFNCDIIENVYLEKLDKKDKSYLSFQDLRKKKNRVPVFSKYMKSLCAFKIENTTFYMDESYINSPLFEKVQIKSKAYITLFTPFDYSCLDLYNSKDELSYILFGFTYEMDETNKPKFESAHFLHDIGDEVWIPRKK